MDPALLLVLDVVILAAVGVLISFEREPATSKYYQDYHPGPAQALAVIAFIGYNIIFGKKIYIFLVEENLWGGVLTFIFALVALIFAPDD